MFLDVIEIHASEAFKGRRERDKSCEFIIWGKKEFGRRKCV